MDLIEKYLPHELPDRYVYISDTLFRLIKGANRGLLEFEDLAVRGTDPGDPRSETGATLSKFFNNPTCGILFDPAHFIYNLFEFDRIPVSIKKQRELIEWKLQKVFPEEISNYIHHYFKISGKTVLSILIRKKTVEWLESYFQNLGKTVTYIGSSTLEIMKRISRSRNAADFFIEISPTVFVLCFQKNHRLFYIRKSKYSSPGMIIEEIQKTCQFITNQFNWKPESFSWIDPFRLMDPEEALREMDAIQLRPSSAPIPPIPFLPKQR